MLKGVKMSLEERERVSFVKAQQQPLVMAEVLLLRAFPKRRS